MCLASVLFDNSPAPKAFGAGLLSANADAKHKPSKSSSIRSEGRFAHLLAGDRAHQRNVPAYICKRFHGRDDPNNQESELNEHGDQAPEKRKKTTDCRDASEDQVNDC